MANVAARLMETYQRAALTLLRMRNGGRQVVTVQHVNPICLPALPKRSSSNIGTSSKLAAPLPFSPHKPNQIARSIT